MKADVAILISKTTEVRAKKNLTKDKKEHYIMLKRSIFQECTMYNS
jgi:hypothetical protein